MQSLIELNHNEPVTTSLAIAEGTCIEHKAVIQLVRKYSDSIQRFGQLTFKMGVVSRHGAGQKAEYAVLNEQQATLLLSFMRNSPIVVKFKVALVGAFYEMRGQLLQQVDTTPRSVQHRADHIVAAGRMFNMLVKSGRTLGLSRAEAVAGANVAAEDASGVNLVQILGAEDVIRPAQERKQNIEALVMQLEEWLEAQGGAEYTSEQLMAEALGVSCPEFADYTLLAAAMQSLGWIAKRIRTRAGQRRGYTKPLTH